jgi:hypothetical protein
MSRQNARKPRFRFGIVGIVETGLPERFLGGGIVKAGEGVLSVRDVLVDGRVFPQFQVRRPLRGPSFAFIQNGMVEVGENAVD